MVKQNKNEKKPYILLYTQSLKNVMPALYTMPEECHVLNFVTKIKPVGKKEV